MIEICNQLKWSSIFGALKHNAVKQLLILCACIYQLCEEQNYSLTFEMAATNGFLLYSLTCVIIPPFKGKESPVKHFQWQLVRDLKGEEPAGPNLLLENCRFLLLCPQDGQLAGA